MALTNFLGGARRPKILDSTDQELVQRVVVELNRLIGIKAPPRFVRVTRYPEAIPQYNLGHQERLKRIESLLKGLPGFFLAGNYLRGVSVADCILRGSLIAQDVAAYLSTGKSASQEGHPL
jgi:oxygen-dependent protoporphyrinogen oxidase